jgi:predicted Rossmann fold nucleotide-binding protein DprA/Smf involved in DNA uptake
MDHRLVLISPYDPAAGFNVGHAMQRNKVIYGLADAALVVTADFEKGGTWAGAIEQLEKLRFVPVFVRNGAHAGKGNAALLQHGAVPWPNPRDCDELSEALFAAVAAATAEPKQETLSLRLQEQLPPFGSEKTEQLTPTTAQTTRLTTTGSPAELLIDTVREILRRELAEPKTEAEVADLLAVSRTQAKAWLKKLVADGVLEKVTKPARYRVTATAGRLL